MPVPNTALCIEDNQEIAQVGPLSPHCPSVTNVSQLWMGDEHLHAYISIRMVVSLLRQAGANNGSDMKEKRLPLIPIR